MAKVTNISEKITRRFMPSPKNVKIPCDYVMVIIRGMAEQASKLAYGPNEVLETPFEELTVGELLDFISANYDGMMIEMIRNDL